MSPHLHFAISDTHVIEAGVLVVAIGYFAVVWPGTCDMIVAAIVRRRAQQVSRP